MSISEQPKMKQNPTERLNVKSPKHQMKQCAVNGRSRFRPVAQSIQKLF